ncbi:MAG TPA: filamentous hemagglutinin family protein, partial [Steroidobacteraceae bacterium]|nr:filamentous hemagglutinin family protein [Steroidobacteraceae bacterium]
VGLDVGTNQPLEQGILTESGGNISIFAHGDVTVGTSRIFTLRGGNEVIWSSTGNIAAGASSKTVQSAPPTRVIVDPQTADVQTDLAGLATGGGIGVLATVTGVAPGNVDLIAPVGFVNAGDAGVGSAGNLNIAAAHVIGLDNIQVAGLSTGVPPAVGGLGASLAGASSVGSSSTNTASAVTKEAGAQQQTTAPIAESALSWLDVFVEGFGEETCKPNDTECLNRNRKP